MIILQLILLLLFGNTQLEANKTPLSYHLDIPAGKKRWLTFPLAESYEYKVVDGEGALHIHEYRKLFSDLGLKIHHLEIKKRLMVFQSEEELITWINQELSPPCGTDNYFAIMKEKGWLKSKDGKIRFPREQLCVLLSHPEDSL